MDIDALLNEINNAGEQKKSKKKNKKTKTVETNDTSLNTDQIVKTFEAIALGDPKAREENMKNALEEDIKEEMVRVLSDEIKLESPLEIVEEEKKKKKKKKKPVTGADGKLELNVEEEIENKINQYRNYFNFSDKTITNSRFQDNASVFRVLKNWDEKEWSQTYFIIN